MNHHYVPVPKAKRSTTTISWPVCKRCGLILLHNRATAAAAAKPCPGKEDPQ